MSEKYTLAQAQIMLRRNICHLDGHQISHWRSRNLAGGIVSETWVCEQCDATFQVTVTYPELPPDDY